MLSESSDSEDEKLLKKSSEFSVLSLIVFYISDFKMARLLIFDYVLWRLLNAI